MQRFFLFLLLTITIAFSGCGVADFMGAYFNTFYNARKLFTEAETEVLAVPLNTSGRQATLGTEEPFMPPYQVPAQAKTKFTSVIEKCSKLLQYHPNSSLVDDALLMIGKSYYYQNEHQSAERKFKELLDGYPDSDLRFEARLLLAQTYYRMKNNTLATAEAKSLLDDARQAGESNVRAKAAELLGAVELQNKNSAAALEYFVEAGEHGEDAEERAAAYRRAAMLYVDKKDPDRALDMFIRSRKAGNTYVSEFRGELGRAQMLSRLGRHEESLSILDDLIKNTNYREFFGEVDLEIGNVYRDMGDVDAALQQYRYVDTAYARSEIASNSYFERGRLYETTLFNFDSAAAAYISGRQQFQTAGIMRDLIKRSDLLSKYLTYRNEILKYDSIKSFILNPPVDSTDSVAQSDSTDVMSVINKDSLETDSTAMPLDGSVGKGAKFAMLKEAGEQRDSVAKAAVIPPPPMDTVNTRLAFNKSELGSLFYSGFGNVDSARVWFSALVHDHPESKYSARALYTLAQIARTDSTYPKSYTDSLYREIVDRFPDSEFAAESRRLLGLPSPQKAVDSLEIRYRRAESLIAEGQTQAALNTLRGIVAADTTSTLSAKSQYTMGWIYENVKPDRDSSIYHYKRLVNRHPSSQYAGAVQTKLQEAEAQRQRELEAAKLEAARKDSASAAANVPPLEKQPSDTASVSGKQLNGKPLPKEPPKKDSGELVPSVPDSSARKEEIPP